ncbi:hypothetical protein GOODEAATRI_017632 [Goodea atripinnis]|uniref:Uncharacterized protein n=1 Tax=Goodea atripinnis TaxID=208336 RepID=A0ABV0PZF6_9TELE
MLGRLWRQSQAQCTSRNPVTEQRLKVQTDLPSTSSSAGAIVSESRLSFCLSDYFLSLPLRRYSDVLPSSFPLSHRLFVLLILLCRFTHCLIYFALLRCLLPASLNWRLSDERLRSNRKYKLGHTQALSV